MRTKPGVDAAARCTEEAMREQKTSGRWETKSYRQNIRYLLIDKALASG
jgi:hypothetical protein